MQPPRSFTAALLSLPLAFALFATARTIPPDTAILIRLDQSVSSQSAKKNQRVKASVAQNVTVEGRVLIPKGSPAAVFVEKVRAADSSGKRAELLLRLDAVTVGPRAYPVFALYAGVKSVPDKAAPQYAEDAAGTPTNAGNTNADVASNPEGAEISLPSATVLAFRLTKSVELK